MRQLSKIDQGLKATAQKGGGHRSRSPPCHSKHKEIDRNLSVAVQHCVRDLYYNHHIPYAAAGRNRSQNLPLSLFVTCVKQITIMAVDPTSLRCNHHFSAEETESKNLGGRFAISILFQGIEIDVSLIADCCTYHLCPMKIFVSSRPSFALGEPTSRYYSKHGLEQHSWVQTELQSSFP